MRVHRRAGRGRKLVAIVLAGAVVALLSISFGSGAGAQVDECGPDVVVAGPILTTPHPTFGPVAAVVPAGTYQLIAQSADSGHQAGKQPDQTHEVWSFTTDTGVHLADHTGPG